MKKLLLMAVSFAVINVANCQIKAFFAPIDENVATKKSEWKLRPVVNIPAFKVIESNRDNAEVDVLMLSSVGGGISLQNIKRVNGKPYCNFSWSPVTFLLSGNLASDNPIDLSVATSFGIFNNLIMIGVGYDFGMVENRSRFFGLLSFGINFNN